MSRKFTVILIPENNGPVTRKFINIPTIKVAATILSSLALVLIGLGFYLGYLGGGTAEIASSKIENEALQQKLDRFEEKVKVLEDEIVNGIEFGQKLRLYADLPQISEDIWQMGVGGPVANHITESKLFNNEYDQQVNEVDETLDKLLRQSKFQRTQYSEILSSLQNREKIWFHMPSIPPVARWSGISKFGWRMHPIYHYVRKHNGLDFICRHGTPIMATANGVVSFAGWKTGFGYTIDVDHSNGIVTRYAHCSLLKASEGDTVSRGEIIARVGSTGLASGPHVHYEVRKENHPLNPIQFVLPEEIPD